MKILKIKKGFITNSSGSYEWLPTSNNSPSDLALPATVSPAPSSQPAINNMAANNPSLENIQKSGLDPSVVLLAAFLGFVIFIIAIFSVIGKILNITKISKK